MGFGFWIVHWYNERINTDATALAKFLSFEHHRKFHFFVKLSALNGSAGYAQCYKIEK